MILFSLVVETHSLDASSHDHTYRVHSTKQISNPIRVHMNLEVLVHQLNGFFISSARHNTTYSRQQCSYCQRSCPGSTLLRYHVCSVSAPRDCCIEVCTAVLNCERATHGLPADRAPEYRGCPDRDPLGCPLIPSQDGIRDKAPTLWLLQLLRLMQLLQLLHACARAINIGHAFTNTRPRSNVR